MVKKKPCECGKKSKFGRVQVKLPGGLTVTKSTETDALAYAARHPGAKVIKAA